MLDAARRVKAYCAVGHARMTDRLSWAATHNPTDRAMLKGDMVRRVRTKKLWRVVNPCLASAQDDATLPAIRDNEPGAGLADEVFRA
jgi:hypothetical protein